MTKVNVYIYWNKELLTETNDEQDESKMMLMPNMVSDCLIRMESGVKNAIDKRNFDDNQWSKLMGYMAIVVVVDKVELMRIQSTNELCLKFAHKEIEFMSKLILQTLDHYANKNKLPDTSDIQIIERKLPPTIFDKDKVFGDGKNDS